MKRWRRHLSWIVLACFVLLVFVNAVGWYGRVDGRLLEARHWDYGWELLLPWEASEGRWSGRDFVYPIGPLWQLCAWLPTLGGSFTAPRAIAGLHLIFPLLSLGVAAWVARVSFEREPARGLALLVLALLALHDDVRSLRALLPLAALVVFVPRRTVRDRATRSMAAAALVSASGWLSLDAGVLGTLSVLLAAAALHTFGPEPGRTKRRTFEFLAALVLFQLAFAAVVQLSGGSVRKLVRGAFEITSAYGTTMAISAEGFTPAKIALFVLLALAILPFIARGPRRDPVALAWLVGTLPFLARAILRSDAEHAYAGVLPLSAVLFLSAIEWWRTRPVLAPYATLLGLVFMLGWFGAHGNRSNAWDVRGFSRAASTLRGHAVQAPMRSDYDRLLAWLREEKARGATCIGLPASKVFLHPLAGVHGPTEMSLGWSAPLQHEMAEAVRSARCPIYVQELVSFDEGSWGFGEYLLALHELYEPYERLGPDLWATRLRAEPKPPERRPLPLSESVKGRLAVPGEAGHRFSRPVPWSHALEIEYQFSVPWHGRLLGGVPSLEVQFHSGTQALGPPMALPYPTLGRHKTVVPIDAAVAEERWVSARAPHQEKSADRMVLSARGNRVSPERIEFSLLSVTELVPSLPERPRTRPCRPEVDLVAEAESRAAFFRSATPSFSRDSIALPPNPKNEAAAELYLPIVPCLDSCLYAELGVEAGENPAPTLLSPISTVDGVDFEIHAIAGYEKPRLVAWHADPGISPKPAELPLGTWVGQDLLLRFATTPGRTEIGDRARIWRPRIAACGSRKNLVVALHDGRYERVRGDVGVLGDTLRMVPAPLGASPTDLRIPVEISAGSCLAMDIRNEDPSHGASRLAVDVGVVDGEMVTRLTRPELAGTDPPASYKEVSLERFWNRSVALRIASWSLDDAPPGMAVIAAMRIHRCGDGAPWRFGG